MHITDLPQNLFCFLHISFHLTKQQNVLFDDKNIIMCRKKIKQENAYFSVKLTTVDPQLGCQLDT